MSNLNAITFQGRELSKSKSATNHVEDVEKLSAELVQARRKNDDKNEIAQRRLTFTDKAANLSLIHI